jgi:hypothetical protein
MEYPTSVVIVRFPRGWVAHIRFEDSSRDEDISSNFRYILDSRIDAYFRSGYETPHA